MVGKIASVLILAVVMFGAVVATASTVTLYSQGIACIDETRTVTLTAGENTIDLPVPAGLIPTSLAVHFAGRVIQQSFHYTPPTSVLSGAIGKQIEVVGSAGSVFQGTLVSTTNGITLRDSTGKIIVIRDPRRISFAGADLPLSPYLELRLAASATGKVPIELTYLATGFNWNMSYVGTLTADGKTLALTGWAQLENNSNYSLSGVTVRLVAGNVNTAKENTAPRAMATPLAAAPMQAQSAFEYYLYPLPAVIDLPANSSTLVPYGEFSVVPVERIYTYDGARAPGVEVALRFSNTTAAGIGVPLPAGTVRLFQPQSGGTMFIGADTIDHTAVGADVTVQAGSAFDITGTRTRTASAKISSSTYRDTYVIVIHNHKNAAVTVNVVEHPAGRTWKLTAASQTYTKVSSNTIKFVVNVPANAQAEITYTIEYSY